MRPRGFQEISVLTVTLGSIQYSSKEDDAIDVPGVASFTQDSTHININISVGV